jgi:hypothetical protein
MRAERWRSSALACALLIAGCQGSCGDKKDGPRVLATVNGTPITEPQLQIALRETLGPDVKNVSETARRKVLESLVATRAMALVAEKHMSESKRAELEREVQAYRDERLIRAYLARHAPVAPITDAQIEAYYREHLADFGAGTLRTYELLAIDQELSGSARADAIAAFAKAERASDWRGTARELTQRGTNVRYESGQLPGNELDKNVVAVINTLAASQASKPFFVDGRIHLVRMLSSQSIAARPLVEVAPQIGRRLEQEAFESAIERAGDKVMQATEIVDRSN